MASRRALLRSSRAERGRGFTLIEMMVVVIIVGVLATLAVVGYRKLIISSHLTEATNMVQSIRVAQEGYHAETQQYANVSQSLTSWYPQPTPTGSQATAWGGKCATQCQAGMDWSMLPLHVDAPVLFGYATVSGGASVAPTPASVSVNGQPLTFPANPTTDWFIVGASCDLDLAGAPNTNVYTTSWANQVYVDGLGN